MSKLFENCGLQLPLLIVFLLGLLVGLFLYETFGFRQTYFFITPPAFKLLRPVKHRNDLAQLIISEGFTTGAEIGVQMAQQENYRDGANLDNNGQEGRLQETKRRLKPFERILHYHRNYSHYAVNEIKDNSLDFIYIDARHDYTGVMQDMILYWSKLKVGGIFAGHDYLDTSETKGIISPNDDWSVDYRGVKRTDDKAVKSAVIEFAINIQKTNVGHISRNFSLMVYEKIIIHTLLGKQ